MESPIAAMESGRPFVRAELGLAANPMTKTTNMMTAGTRRSDTGDTSLEAADPGGLLPARDGMNHCLAYAERYSPYPQESTGRQMAGQGGESFDELTLGDEDRGSHRASAAANATGPRHEGSAIGATPRA